MRLGTANKKLRFVIALLSPFTAFASRKIGCGSEQRIKKLRFVIALLSPFTIFARKIFIIMDNLYKIKQGLDINLKGVAQQKCTVLPRSSTYALMPDDFHGVTPKVVVKEGDDVKAGSALFVDKATERVKFCSPVSGRVKAVVRGDRRKVIRVEVEASEQQEYKGFLTPGAKVDSPDKVLELLLESGFFAYFRSRPYDVVASPDDKPKAIFISTFSKMPLAADFSYVVKGREDAFKAGVRLLSQLAKVHIGICPEQINTAILPVNEAEVSVFSGPNPSGNVGVHINRISPVNKGEVVWTVGAEVVVMLGELMVTGHADYVRHIAVAGSEVKDPQYLEVTVGAPLADVFADQLSTTEHVRLINGNPLVGKKAELTGYLSAMVTEVCAIPEGDDVDEMFGWIAPRLNDFSTSRSYFTWLQGKNKTYDLDCRIKGGERHMIMSGEYDRVFPMDIYAGYLVKAIITGDIDRQEQLGIYEVAPEDFAVAEFVDSSKLELQRIVREGLDILRKENA